MNDCSLGSGRQRRQCGRSDRRDFLPGITGRRRAQAGAISTATPPSTALPESGSRAASSSSAFMFTPGRSRATPSRTPSRSCPQPCGRLTTPGLMSALRSTRATSSPTALLTLANSARPSRSASAGCTSRVQRSGPLASTGRLCIQLLPERVSRRPISVNSGAGAVVTAARSARRAAGASSILPLGVRSISGMRGVSAPRSTPPPSTVLAALTAARFRPPGWRPNWSP
mmetsp:Transcript_45703/g.80571  ORF Transcript_45703/g.80571 Transcript_45703/m.80571 type:complete len:228 (-) Transcript_45703:11-694(-)